MNAEFNWWLLIVGLVVGGGLVWFVLLDARRREEDVEASERPGEALWLARSLADEGYDVEPELAERVLELHRFYLEAPPPDDPLPQAPTPDVLPPDVADAEPPSGESTPEPSELAGHDRVRTERRPADLDE